MAPRRALEFVSRPVWGAWIEIRVLYHARGAMASRPVWGAWIEMRSAMGPLKIMYVAPRMGRVD